MTIHAFPTKRVRRAGTPPLSAARMVVSDGKPTRRVGIRYPWIRSDDRRAA